MGSLSAEVVQPADKSDCVRRAALPGGLRTTERNQKYGRGRRSAGIRAVERAIGSQLAELPQELAAVLLVGVDAFDL